MNVIETEIPGVLIFEPKVFSDARGCFLEIWNEDRYDGANISAPFLQDNFCRSSRGTLRGLHLQSPTVQGKLVTATRGSVFDVVVDVRRGSPTFGKWVSVILDDQERKQIWVPRGFAHGFCVLSDVADVLYKIDAPYRPQEEISVAYNDPEIGIAWPMEAVILSDKDRAARPLSEISGLPVFDRDSV